MLNGNFDAISAVNGGFVIIIRFGAPSPSLPLKPKLIPRAKFAQTATKVP